MPSLPARQGPLNHSGFKQQGKVPQGRFLVELAALDVMWPEDPLPALWRWRPQVFPTQKAQDICTRLIRVHPGLGTQGSLQWGSLQSYLVEAPAPMSSGPSNRGCQRLG